MKAYICLVATANGAETRTLERIEQLRGVNVLRVLPFRGVWEGIEDFGLFVYLEVSPESVSTLSDTLREYRVDANQECVFFHFGKFRKAEGANFTEINGKKIEATGEVGLLF